MKCLKKRISKKWQCKMPEGGCATLRGNHGYCAAHPSALAMDCGPIHTTRADAARAYAAAEWQCDPIDMRVCMIATR